LIANTCGNNDIKSIAEPDILCFEDSFKAIRANFGTRLAVEAGFPDRTQDRFDLNFRERIRGEGAQTGDLLY
jgi:hypothetical protein